MDDVVLVVVFFLAGAIIDHLCIENINSRYSVSFKRKSTYFGYARDD